jgi:hypothetical protein
MSHGIELALHRAEIAMEAQPNVQSAVQPTGCCPPFNPTPWQDKELTWKDELFVRDHVRSVFHVPLNMGKRVVANQTKIDAAQAAPAERLMLTEETSPWGSDIYIRVTKPVPDARMASLSGTFLTRVYEGPFRDEPKWAEDMRRFVAARGRTLEKLYFSYTTCPACAKAYGKNYVVVLAKVA